jgi:hypothetical protein
MNRPYSASSDALKLDGDAALFDDQLGSDAMRDGPHLYAISLQNPTGSMLGAGHPAHLSSR